MAYLLGARLDGKDPRSRAFQARLAPDIHSVQHRHGGPVLDQWVGSCTGHAATQALNTKPHHVPRSKYFNDQVAMNIYMLATKLDIWAGSYPPDDTGSSVLAAAKAAQRLELIKEYHWAFGYDQMLAALMIKPVVVGTIWHHNMFHPGPYGFLDVSGSIVGGHSYLITGYAAHAKFFTILNSWGIGWARKGRARIKADDMRTLIESDGEAATYS